MQEHTEGGIKFRCILPPKRRGSTDSDIASSMVPIQVESMLHTHHEHAAISIKPAKLGQKIETHTKTVWIRTTPSPIKPNLFFLDA